MRDVDVLVVFAVALVTALATGLGALPFVFSRRPDRTWLGMANSLAAGLMLGASLGLCYEGASYGIEPTALGVLAGCVFLLVSGRPLEEPVAWYGPIVMNTRAEIQQAYAELKDGTFIK